MKKYVVLAVLCLFASPPPPAEAGCGLFGCIAARFQARREARQGFTQGSCGASQQAQAGSCGSATFAPQAAMPTYSAAPMARPVTTRPVVGSASSFPRFGGSCVGGVCPDSW